MKPKLSKINLFVLLFLVILFYACESKVDFFQDDNFGKKTTTTKGNNENCTIKIIDDQEICVEPREELFNIETLGNKHVDFLFVLDVSPSMTEDLARLGQAFEDLMSQIKNSRWQMFFTTADHGDHDYNILPSGKKVFTHQKWQDHQGNKPHFGQFMNLEHNGTPLNQKILNANTPRYIEVFKDTLTRKVGDTCSLAPYCQGALEQPLRVLNSSLERLSRSSTLALSSATDFVSFIITDEDERSEDPSQATSAKDVYNNFKKLFPKKSFHAISLVVQDQNCLNKQQRHSPQSSYGTKVAALSKLTHGKTISICEENYGSHLKDVSYLLRTLIESLKLQEQPVSKEDIVVEFIKGTPRIDWSLKGQKIVFNNTLEAGSQIKVSYFVKAK